MNEIEADDIKKNLMSVLGIKRVIYSTRNLRKYV